MKFIYYLNILWDYCCMGVLVVAWRDAMSQRGDGSHMTCDLKTLLSLMHSLRVLDLA